MLRSARRGSVADAGNRTKQRPESELGTERERIQFSLLFEELFGYGEKSRIGDFNEQKNNSGSVNRFAAVSSGLVFVRSSSLVEAF